MNTFQDRQTRIPAVRSSGRERLYVDAQPGALDSEERGGIERVTRHGKTLRTDVVRLSAQLEVHAGSLVKRRFTGNVRLHWQTRGRQALLRQAAMHLLNIATTYHTEYTPSWRSRTISAA